MASAPAQPGAKALNTPADDARALRSLVPYLWPKDNTEIRVRVVVAMLMLVAAKVATVYVPVLYAKAVDALTATDPAQLAIIVPTGVILAYGLVRIMSLAFSELRDAVFAKVAMRAIRNAALNVFRHLHALSLRFHLDRQTGGLSRIIERGTRAIESLLRFSLFNVIPTLLEILMVSALMWWFFDFLYALVTFVSVVGYVVFTAVVTEWRLAFRRAMNEADQQANTKAIDSLLNFETVKYFGNERHEADRFDESMQRYESAAVRSLTSLSLLNVGQAVIIATGLTLIMYMAARGIAAGEMSVGDFVMVNTYLIQLYQPLNFFGFVYREIKQSLTDIHQMFVLLDVDQEVSDKPEAKPLSVTGGAVSFKNVEFGYDPRRPILKGVSFDIHPGETLAVVGPTGAGKSTISRLLFRFYDATGGSISIDGQDVRDVAQESVRATIGIVPQDTVLFNDTIYYNIAYGRPNAAPSEVEAAARSAFIHDFIQSTPDGYQTRVGERGLKLSGGEKQRVAIARTILKNPRILLFDEATSALDTRTERAIQQNLREVSEGRTTLVIAHRLSTVVDADTIIVLADGEIAEQGRHEELLALDGRYAKMWMQQQQSLDESPSPRITAEAAARLALVDGKPE